MIISLFYFENSITLLLCTTYLGNFVIEQHCCRIKKNG